MPCTTAQPAPFAMTRTNVFLHFESILQRCLPKRFREKSPYVCLEKCSFYNRESRQGCKITLEHMVISGWMQMPLLKFLMEARRSRKMLCWGVGGERVILMTTPLRHCTGMSILFKKSLNSQISNHTSLPRYMAFGKFTWSCFHWTRKWSAKWYIIFPDNDNVFTRQILSTNTMITSLTPLTWRREIVW